MKDLTKLTDEQRANLTIGKWWDPATLATKGNGPTKPVEIVGEPVANQVTLDLCVPVRRRANLAPFQLTVDRLISHYVPRATVAAVPVEVLPVVPQMTLPRIDMPAWAVEMERNIAFLVAAEKARAVLTTAPVYP